MPLTAQGIKKQLVIKKQVSLGSLASGSGGQVLRRRTSIWEQKKAEYKSDEIVSHQQSTGARYGMGTVTGKHSGLLSPGTFKLWMAAVCRKDFAAGAATGAIATVTAAVTSGAAGTFTRSAGSYLSDGFKQFDVVRWAGWATTGVPNNAHNFWITSLSATVMTVLALDGVAVGAKASGDSVTGTVVGKKTLVPLTGHTDDIFTVENWHPDLSPVVSELYGDVKVDAMSIGIPASGNVTVDFDLNGLSESVTAAQVLTTPTAETTTEILSAVRGSISVNGALQTTITGLTVNVKANTSVDGPVIGTNAGPNVSRGKVEVSGQFQAYFTDSTLMLLLSNETNIGIGAVATCDNTATSDFIALSMTRVKIATDTPDDGEKGIIRTYNFNAEIDSAGGAALANDQTIISFQDSAA